ncbi:MAG: Uma2 family endonuclease [Eubacterium sp.]|nr:Uma2 family endonuclease [Eubacterium sp.]
MTIDEMKNIKREHGLTYDDISKKTGVPLGTVTKIFTGVSTSPRRATIEKLSGFFAMLNKSTIEERHDYYIRNYLPPLSTQHQGDVLSDNMAEYAAVRSEAVDTRWGIPVKKQGDYTIEDYYMIPDEFRVELIDGVIYDMGAPTTIHQFLVGEIYVLFHDYIKANKGGCIPYLSPVSVELESSRDTVVQPDMMVLCKDRMDRLKRGRIYGGPDLVVEIISPSTKRKDCIDKLHNYEKGGVREYWIVDPDKKMVMVYDFSSEVSPTIYGFRDKIPVDIYNGDLVIDFAKIDDYMEQVYKDIPEED